MLTLFRFRYRGHLVTIQYDQNLPAQMRKSYFVFIDGKCEGPVKSYQTGLIMAEKEIDLREGGRPQSGRLLTEEL